MRLRAQGIEDTLKGVVAEAVRQIAPAIQRQLATLAAEELERTLSVNGANGSRQRMRRTRRRGEEITCWVADRRARRVPLFVIAMTGGLDTKKKIVERYGMDAVFERDKPLPRAAHAA
ncbi:MAG TPA: hypothetical protein VMK12_12270 [Anaeromyxobacteraceae bacterium]|nr:hypothetical protein [Anaeromyxobacteraceae bacterium]